ncbi:MAG TPA: PilZ domain-containing protein [Polyangia bacterium]|nr:PilZ domain-containing protein [Polyangia bacterium]
MTAEHRRQARHALRVSAEVRLGTRLITGTTRNLSEGGMCLEIDSPLTEGDAIKIRLFPVEDDIEAEGARGLELIGRVQWSAEAERGFAIGVQFKDLTAAQTAAITATLKRLEP